MQGLKLKFNPIQDMFFQDCSGMGEGQKRPFP